MFQFYNKNTTECFVSCFFSRFIISIVLRFVRYYICPDFIRMKYILKSLLSFFCCFTAVWIHCIAQTNIAAGYVSGTWTKAGSPYKINGNITVPLATKLIINEGVKVEFQGAYKLDVRGILKVLGKASDTVVFTVKDTLNGWNGIVVHQQSTSLPDSIIFSYCKVERIGVQSDTLNTSVVYGLALDTIPRLRISNTIFTKNRAQKASCIYAVKSNLLMYNVCITGNWVKFNEGTPGCIIEESKLSCFNSWFVGNSKSNYTYFPYRLAGILELHSVSLEVFGNTFEKNKPFGNGTSRLSGIRAMGHFSGVIEKNRFIDNDGGISIDQVDNIYIKGNYFEGNRESIGMAFSGLGTYATTSIVLDSNVCYHNKISKFNKTVNAHQTLKIINHREFNSDSGIVLLDINKCFIYNSIFANNKSSITADLNGDLYLLNSLLVNNRPDSAEASNKDSFASGLKLLNGIYAYSRNCIFSGNRSASGYIKNIQTCYNNYPSFVYLSNCLIEGGKTSTNLKEKNNLGLYSSIVEEPARFTQASSGAGYSFDGLSADWHPVNHCFDLSSTFNKGTSQLPDLAVMPAKDLDGNPRVAKNFVDIGPYELQNNYLPVVQKEPADTALCLNASADIMPFSAFGENLHYDWQVSADGKNWVVLKGEHDTFLGKQTSTLPGSFKYRALVSNSACNNFDTTRVALLTVYPFPVPLPNLGPDQSIPYKGSVVLTPGIFNHYSWFNGFSSSSFTADYNSVDTGKNTIWVEVSEDHLLSGGEIAICRARDTVIINRSAINSKIELNRTIIKLYPVPAHEKLSIVVPGKTIYQYEILDVQGKRVAVNYSSLKGNADIDIENLSEGVYTLKLNLEEGYVLAKFIKR